jgi:hypothetical protein
MGKETLYEPLLVLTITLDPAAGHCSITSNEPVDVTFAGSFGVIVQFSGVEPASTVML